MLTVALRVLSGAQTPISRTGVLPAVYMPIRSMLIVEVGEPFSRERGTLPLQIFAFSSFCKMRSATERESRGRETLGGVRGPGGVRGGEYPHPQSVGGDNREASKEWVL